MFFVALSITVAPSMGYADSFCKGAVKSGVASGKTEAEAKAAATKWWSSRAGALGEGYQDWDRAKDKSLICHPGPFETFKCTASAKPCLPEGKLPDDPDKKDL
ncbi:MAG: hypothetical protein JSR99_17705 [Proteobacteria bacterium]|nr:hypothetical protein [Pseudomonadota bacterium]